MFSIVIPLYNKSPYILKAFDSVLAQTFQDYEIIIMDDGSTDDGLHKLKRKIKELQFENQAQYNKVIIIEQPNQGVSSARNNGAKAAKYDFIAFLDADDWWKPSFLQEMKSLIFDYPDAGVYGCKYFWIKNGNEKVSVNHENEEFRGYIDYIKAYTYDWWMPLSSISVVIPKRIYNEFGGFKRHLKFAEDFDLWIRIVLKYKVGYINKPLSYYNQDVDLSNRALGSEKIYPPDCYSTFNWGFLEKDEKINVELKKLLDGLRVRSLIRYHLSGKYPNETLIEISKVDFTKQSAYYKRVYHYPLAFVKLYFKIKKTGSKVKQSFLKLFKKKV